MGKASRRTPARRESVSEYSNTWIDMRHDSALNRHVRSPEGPVPAEPTRPLPGLRVGSRQTRGHSPADSDICEPGSPAVPGAETDRHRATSSPRRSWPGTASGAPNAAGARNGSQRVQPPSDVERPGQILLAGQGLPARLGPTVTDTPEFPDTEEVTGSNPVRPTRSKAMTTQRKLRPFVVE
jgi:hypothetical protein